MCLNEWSQSRDHLGPFEPLFDNLFFRFSYILLGKLKLIDPVSGKGTSWGYWDPIQLNGIPGKPNERGENSLEVLGFNRRQSEKVITAILKSTPNETVELLIKKALKNL